MTKEESEAFYKEMRKTMTDEEIAESFIWSVDRTPEEEKADSEAIRAHIKKRYAEMSWRKRTWTRLRARYLGYKYRFQDWLHNE